MTSDLGVWTADDCAFVLIDYQTEMVEVIRSETNADLVELHARLLAKTAKAFDVPIVLSTVGVDYGFNGPTVPSLLAELDGIEPIDRTSMNAFEDEAFRDAVAATGRKRLIIGRSAHGDLSRLRDGLGAEGRLRGDVRHRRRRWAFPDRAPDRHRPARARRRGADHGARGRHRAASATGPVRSTNRLSTSSTGTSDEVPKHTDQVGVADAEKRAAAARGAH